MNCNNCKNNTDCRFKGECPNDATLLCCPFCGECGAPYIGYRGDAVGCHNNICRLYCIPFTRKQWAERATPQQMVDARKKRSLAVDYDAT